LGSGGYGSEEEWVVDEEEEEVGARDEEGSRWMDRWWRR